MPKNYTVLVTRTYVVDVEAETEDEAITEAETNFDELSHGWAVSTESSIIHVN